jgi:hypothetical protein
MYSIIFVTTFSDFFVLFNSNKFFFLIFDLLNKYLYYRIYKLYFILYMNFITNQKIIYLHSIQIVAELSLLEIALTT